MGHAGTVNCWVINVGEPIPQLDENVRAFRYAMVTNALLRAGHTVVRWSSTFRHITKDFRTDKSDRRADEPNLSFRFLHGLGYQWHRSPRRLIHHALEARAFRETARAEPNPDLVFVSIPTLDLASEAIRFGQERKVPIVVDISDCWPDHYLTMLPRFFRPIARPLLAGKYRQLRNVLGAASGVTSISQTFLDWAKARGAAEVPYAGVFPIGYEWPKDVGAEHPEILSQRGVSQTDFIILFVGTFTGSYDFTAPIQAARIFAKESPEVKFVFAGSGPREKELKQAENELPNFKVLGWINQPKILAQLVSSAKVGLCPYRHDSSMSLPNKPFEYMAAGKPVISSLAGEFQQIVVSEGIGLHYQSRDSGALLRAIRELRQAPETVMKMSKRAGELFREQYTPERIYPNLVSALEKIGHLNVPSLQA